MTEQTKTVLKSYFQTGDKPTQQDFIDLIDSFVTETSAGNNDIPNNRILANIIGASAAAIGNTISDILDATITTTRGTIVFRGSAGWEYLAPGTSGQLLSSGGAGADISWSTASGTGTVTSVSAGGGLTASTNPIVATGDISLKDIPAQQILMNPTSVSAAPVGTTLTRMIDSVVSGSQGSVLYRNASDWVALAPGTTGQVLTTAGVSANPSWGNAGAPTVIYDQTLTNATSVDVSGLSTYKEITIEANSTFSSSNALIITTETSGTYHTSYSWIFDGTSTGNGSSHIRVGNQVSTARRQVIKITSLGDANMPTTATYSVATVDPFIYNGMGYRTSAQAENGIRIALSLGGTFSGRLKVTAI